MSSQNGNTVDMKLLQLIESILPFFRNYTMSYGSYNHYSSTKQNKKDVNL